MFERGFTLKVSTRRLGLKVLPEGNKGESIVYQPNANGTKKRELCTLRVEYIAHYKEGGHTGLLPPVWHLGEGKRRILFSLPALLPVPFILSSAPVPDPTPCRATAAFSRFLEA